MPSRCYTCRRSVRHRSWWPGVVLAALLLAGLAGCGLDESARVECRCTPETNLNLFPACPDLRVIDQDGGPELWVTATGDTLNPEVEAVIAQGDQVRYGKGDTANPFASDLPDCPVGPRLMLNEPTRPSLVVFNLQTILRAQPEARSLDQYMDQLSQHFTFVPDPQDVQLYPEVYDTSKDTLWHREQERRFAQAILDAGQVGQINLTRWYKSAADERVPSEDQLLETFIFPYEGSLVRRDAQDEGDTVLEFKGTMELDLVTPTLENPVWSVQQWRDFRDPASAKRSWGELRAEFTR